MAARQEPEPIVPALAIQDAEDAVYQQDLNYAGVGLSPVETSPIYQAMALQRADKKAGRERFVDKARHAKAVPDSALRPDYPTVLDTAAYMLIANEEARFKPYRDDGVQVSDKKPANTAGIGHLIKKGEEDLPWYDPRFVHDVFLEDLRAHAAIAVRLFELDPKVPEETIVLADMPHEMQAFIIDGTFNGMIGQSPKTRSLLKQGNWKEAAKEYTRSDFWDTKGGKRRMTPFVEYLREHAKIQAKRQKATTND